MAKLTRIIRNTDPVSETDANAVFELLVPIVEIDPSAGAAVETAGDVIRRCSLGDDRHLSHVLDWWYVVTTGRPSANGGAYRLPESLDGRVRSHMTAVIALEVALPAAEWLDKRRRLDSWLTGLDEFLKLDQGAVKLPAEREVWSWLSEQLGVTTERLRTNRQAAPAEIDFRKLEQELRDRGVEVGSRRYKRMLRRCREATDHISQIVDLQGEVEPWIPRITPGIISEVPNEFKHAVGPLAEALLRPILATNAAPAVNRELVAERIDAAGRGGDRRGRYKLARVVNAWCEQTGQSIASLEDEIRRHRSLTAAMTELEAKSSAADGIEEIELHVLDDDIDGAEKALSRLREQISRRERTELAHRQLEGLRRKLRESSLSEDAAWIERVADIEDRLDTTDPHEMAREIGTAQTELSARLDELLQEQQEDLMQLLMPLKDLRAADSVLREWERRITELKRRGGRGANELKQEIEEYLRQLREEFHAAVEQQLTLVQGILTDEREDFSGEDLGYFANWHSEITGWLQDPDLANERLAEARESANELWSDVEDRRIHRWQADQGEGELVDHLLNYCTGPLDFDPMDIRRLYVSLKTRPFVILAGLTGSGKSSLTRAYAEAFGANSYNGRFRRIAVRPDWIDQTEVLGFVNPISERFVPGWLAETVRDCEREPDRLHFVLLDEMNLAPVEQYLAEWLSAIEEARSGSDDVRMPLYSSAMAPKNADEWPPSLKFPDNLMIVGTVNVDETTRPLSERVLDRANVLLLSVEVSDRHHEPNGQVPAPWHVGIAEWRKVCTTEPSDDHHDFLAEIADILRQARIGVGLRAHLELERFVANAEGILDDESALDWGIVQRIIPKIRGFKGHLAEILKELLEEFDNVGANQSASIVRRWLDDSVSDDEFLEGTDPRLALARI
ncbi:MAG: AAA family ATPase [Acidimicrobiaceae bacterium]|nr:AAA family ATPase [Acidimicrobiaceae bacterium]